ncbi:MAG: transposase [Niabella sp.]
MPIAGVGLKLGNQPTFVMLLNELKIIEIFCQLDDFAKECKKIVDVKLIGSSSSQSVHKPGISDLEMACIELRYHLSGYKCFQYYYQHAVDKGPLKSLLSQAPGYNRFVQLKPRILPLMILYLNLCHPTALVMCHSRRIYSHKVFSEQVRRGKICAGWFYGFKLFLVVNVFGEIIKVMFTTGNVADSNTEHMLKLLTNSKVRYLSTEGLSIKKYLNSY